MRILLDEIGLGSIFLENVKTGETYSMDDVSGVRIGSDLVYEYNKPYELPKRTSFDASMEIELLNGQINQDRLNQVIGIDESRLPDKYDLTIFKPIQKRRHKKKRINKKWAKRYGYIMASISTKEWKIKTSCKDNTFTFVKEK